MLPLSLSPVELSSRADVFRQFTRPLDDDPALWEGEPPPKHESLESAEAALAFLVEQGMVVVANDEITVPSHFLSGDPSTASPDEAPTPGLT